MKARWRGIFYENGAGETKTKTWFVMMHRIWKNVHNVVYVYNDTGHNMTGALKNL